MRIAYIIVPLAVVSGNSNGIKSQAITWKNGMQKAGHEVDEINLWNNYNWKKYDLIHIFGTGLWLYTFVQSLSIKNPNIVLSPIIDSLESPTLYSLVSQIGSTKLKLWSPTFTLRKTLPLIRGVYVRSQHEAKYIKKMMSQDQIHILPLATSENNTNNSSSRDNFCLHISSISQPRKNVLRLIKAAKKYNFKLVLAGSTGSEIDFKPLREEIGDAKNISVLGFISHEEKIKLYSKAKVFALPSLNEGVGIVALDAAILGCEIVLTKLGAPKEYYNGSAELVDPFNIDSIGKSIVKILNNEIKHQPELSSHIMRHYSSLVVNKKLIDSYQKILNY